jgi:hypothetical protein
MGRPPSTPGATVGETLLRQELRRTSQRAKMARIFFARTLRMADKGGLYMFLRNEPTVFRSDFGYNLYGMSNLQTNVTENFGGFVFQNEPTGRVFLGGREGKWTQIGGRIARMGLMREERGCGCRRRGVQIKSETTETVAANNSGFAAGIRRAACRQTPLRRTRLEKLRVTDRGEVHEGRRRGRLGQPALPTTGEHAKKPCSAKRTPQLSCVL